jgi:aldose 1-epimerase
MPIDIVTITDALTGSTAAIAPALGFNCFSFAPVVAGQPVEVLWHDPQFRDGNTRPSRSGIPILFPFAGRIREGKYRYRGREYQLETNDNQGNAIHGFAYTRPWRVIAQTPSSVTGEFQAAVDDSKILKLWPADFRIRATYTVQDRQLLARYEFRNTGDGPLPWWFGTHPYFRLSLGGDRPEDAVIRFAVDKQWELANLIPTGKVIGVPDAAEFAAGAKISKREFDNAFSGLGIESKPWSGSVTDTAAQRTTATRFGKPFRECVIFIPPHREAICLEPYTAVPNAFELTDRGIDAGLAELLPSQSQEVQVEITCSEASHKR